MGRWNRYKCTAILHDGERATVTVTSSSKQGAIYGAKKILEKRQILLPSTSKIECYGASEAEYFNL